MMKRRGFIASLVGFFTAKPTPRRITVGTLEPFTGTVTDLDWRKITVGTISCSGIVNESHFWYSAKDGRLSLIA